MTSFHKHRIASAILIVLCLGLSSCGGNGTDAVSNESFGETTIHDLSITEEACAVSEFPPDVITVDGDTVLYNNGKIEFRWNKNDWFLSSDAYGLPSLEKRVDGLIVSFKVFDCIEGTAGDLAKFSCDALQKAFPDYDSDKQFACGSDASCKGKDCFGIQTGYYTHLASREGNAMAIVHSVSNGAASCVYGVLFKGVDEKVAELHDALMESHDLTLLEDYIRDVSDTFQFVS